MASMFHTSSVQTPASADSTKELDTVKASCNPYRCRERHNDSSSQLSREPTEEHPRRRSYWIASLTLTAVSLLMAMGSVITAAVMFKKINEEPGEALSFLFPFIMYIVTIVEAALCVIAMITCIALLACRPRSVLIRDRHNGGFVCLCASVFFLALLAIYSFCVPIVLKNEKPKVSAALCIIPGVRFVALLAFFAVLVANSQL